MSKDSPASGDIFANGVDLYILCRRGDKWNMLWLNDGGYALSSCCSADAYDTPEEAMLNIDDVFVASLDANFMQKIEDDYNEQMQSV